PDDRASAGCASTHVELRVDAKWSLAMTAPAAAPAAAPIAPAAPRAAPQPPADRFAFAAVLDSLPRAPAKASASTPEQQPRASNESLQEETSRGQTAHNSA